MPTLADQRRDAEQIIQAHVRVPGPTTWRRRLGVVPWPVRTGGPVCACGEEWPCPWARSADCLISGRVDWLMINDLRGWSR